MQDRLYSKFNQLKIHNRIDTDMDRFGQYLYITHTYLFTSSKADRCRSENIAVNWN